jgi:hypothetical protein
MVHVRAPLGRVRALTLLWQCAAWHDVLLERLNHRAHQENVVFTYFYFFYFSAWGKQKKQILEKHHLLGKSNPLYFFCTFFSFSKF